MFIEPRLGHAPKGPSVPSAFTALDGPSGLVSARPGPDLAAHGWTETEYVVRGTGRGVRREQPSDGRWSLAVAGEAEFATRCVVRRPAGGAAFSGTLVVEWLNVSSGTDTAPDWTYLSDEIVRRGHVWVGVSAQYVGVEGGSGDGRRAGPEAAEGGPAVRRAGPPRGRLLLRDLHRGGDRPDRLAAQRPGGDLPAGGGGVAVGVRADDVRQRRAPAHRPVRRLPGPLARRRRDAARRARERAGPRGFRNNEPAGPRRPRRPGGHRADRDRPDRAAEVPAARQPDSGLLRLWEVAGTAHADKFQIGEFEDFLGCPRPVNTGQQAYVVRAALRHLEAWARGGDPAPAADRLEVVDGTFVLDDDGNARGGVRTPCVDAPTSVLRGDTDPDAR